jgi:hypothetical protein
MVEVEGGRVMDEVWRQKTKELPPTGPIRAKQVNRSSPVIGQRGS